jgi:hypothetical protein
VVSRTGRVLASCAASTLLGLLAGCKPDLDQTLSVVSDPIVLAVRSDPAEQAPSARVRLTALYVDHDGVIEQAPISWAFCTARNPLANLGSVNPKCLEASGSWIQPIGSGVVVSGLVPDIACQQFGPFVPQPQTGQPQGRPVDPDPTGGYYQPAHLFVPSEGGTLTDISETRLVCGPGLAQGVAGPAFNRRYHTNVNPEVSSLGVLQGGTIATRWSLDPGSMVEPPPNPAAGMPEGGSSDAGTTTGQDGGQAPAGPNVVMAGAHVTLRAEWAACPVVDKCGDGVCGPDEELGLCKADCANPVGCTGAERFVSFDVGSQSLVDLRESIDVGWYTTAGAFDADSTGRTSSDMDSSSDNGWTAPKAPGTVHMWVVLRDDRGGAGWGQYTVLVQ